MTTPFLILVLVLLAAAPVAGVLCACAGAIIAWRMAKGLPPVALPSLRGGVRVVKPEREEQEPEDKQPPRRVRV